jgi:hypothetical protein
MAKTYQFGVEDVLTHLGLSGLATVEPQSFNAAIDQKEASAFGNFGDIIVDGNGLNVTTMYDVTIKFSLSLKAIADTITGQSIILGGNGTTGKGYVLTSLPYGTGTGGMVIENFSQSNSPGVGSLSISGHVHYRQSGDTTSLHSTRCATVNLPTWGKGVQTLPISLVANSQSFVIADIGTYSFAGSITHEDVLSRKGFWKFGTSYNARLTESFELFSASDSDGTQNSSFPTLLTPAAGWNWTSDSNPQTNTAYKKRSFSLFSYQATA